MLADQVHDHAERVALVDEELLPLRGVVHLGSVLADETVEKRIEALVVAPLGTQDAPEALRFLPARAKVRRDLDEAGRLGQIDRRVADLGQEDGVDDRVVLEVLQDAHALDLWRTAVDVRLAELDGVRLERIHIVGKDDDLVAAILVVLDEVLRRLELGGVHAVQQHLLAALFAEVLAVEFGGHRAPHLGALHRRNVSLGGKIHPVGLVQLRAHKEVELVNLFVLTYERRWVSGKTYR